MYILCRLTPVAIVVLCMVYVSDAAAKVDESIKFDIRQLESRGFSADLADYFGRASRFLPGNYPVQISVNANRQYHTEARFDNDGNLCVTPSLQATLRLKSNGEQEDCAEIGTIWPEAKVRLFPGEYRVELTLPEEAFLPDGRDDGLQRGGSAALLNYNLFGQRIDSKSSGYNFFQAELQPGFNADGWSVRSRGLYTYGDKGGRYQQQEVFVQRPVESLTALAQLGQISNFGQTFGGLPIVGAQIGTDQAQLGATALAIPIQGLAGSQATIEVRQRGRLLYRTVVQPGPFVLSEIGGMAGGADLDVDVIEESGERTRFTVPALAQARMGQQSNSWFLALGRYRAYGGSGGGATRSASLAIGELALNATDILRVTSAAVFSAPYQAIGVESNWTASDSGWLTAGARVARTRGFGQGAELSALSTFQLGSNLSTSLSWVSRIADYADATEAFESAERLNEQLRLRQAAAATVSWVNPLWGAISYTATYNRYSEVGRTSGFSHNVNLGRRFGRANVTLSLQRRPREDFGAFLNLRMPLGKGAVSINAYRTADKQISASTSYDGQIGNDQNYSVGITGNKDDKRLSASTSISSAYSTFSAGVSQSTSNFRSLYASASGALVYAGGTLGSSPAPVADTFALVKVPNQAGLRMRSPGSASKTNVDGTAVIPNVMPYVKGQLQVDTRSMALNTRLDTTTLNLMQARGSVGIYHIGSAEVRQLLLTIRDGNGKASALGTTVYDEGGDILGVVVGNGNVMLMNEQIGKKLVLVGADGNRCRVTYAVPTRFDANSSYEEADARCE